jgi:hypothetical protein
MSLKINFLTSDSISEVIEFFNSAQNDKEQANNRSLKEFEWLFINGLTKPAIYAIASDDQSDEIIGTYAGIYIPMISKEGELIVTVKGEDTLLSLDRMIRYGKTDILKELFKSIIEKAKAENASFMWGFTPARAAFKRCGYEIVTQIKGSFYVIRPMKFYRTHIRRFPKLSMAKKLQLFGFSWYNYFTHKVSFKLSERISYKKISLDEIDEKILLSFIPKNVFTTYLNKKFLQWRIEDNPSELTYGFLEFRDKNHDVISYFIFSHNNENVWFVEQFLFPDNLPDEMKIRIMKLAFTYCKTEKAILIRALGFSHNLENIKEMDLLTKSGFYFFNNPEESYFVFHNLSDHRTDPEDIYLSRLNTQGIR